jgi:pimeloyl-ACP methyl ester carboxylesterase
MINVPGARELDFELTDGRTLGYGLYGAEEGPLVVVLDGPGSRGLGRALAAPAHQLGIKLLVVDRPGFGRSTPDPRGSFPRVAEAIVALTDHLEYARCGILAQSGGTPYALALASAGGDRIMGLGFIGALAPLDGRHGLGGVGGPMRPAFLLARYAPWLLAPVCRALARKSRRDPEAAARAYAERLPPDDRAVLDDPAYWAIHATSSAEILSHPRALAREVRLLVQPWNVDFRAVTAPVAMWVGELDVTHPPAASHRLARLLGGAPVTVVPGAATFAMLTIFPDALRHAAAMH